MRLIVKRRIDLLSGEAPVEGFPVKLCDGTKKGGIVLVRPPSGSSRTKWHLASSDAESLGSTCEPSPSLCGVEECWEWPESMWEHSRSGNGPGVSLCDACIREGKITAPKKVGG